MADSKTQITLNNGKPVEGWETKTTDGGIFYVRSRDTARNFRKLSTEDLLREHLSSLLETKELVTLLEERDAAKKAAEAIKPETPKPTRHNTHIVSQFLNPHWAGLGETLVPGLSPSEALEASGLNWEVEGVVPSYELDSEMYMSKTAQLVVRLPRAGRNEQPIELAKTGTSWKPIQNREMFDIAQLACQNGLQMDSAGSTRNGKQVFAFLSSDAFNVTRLDEIQRGILLVMGHDGELTLRAIPLSLRKTCMNGLRMMIKEKRSWFALRHNGDIQAKMAVLLKVISGFQATSVKFEEQAKAMANKKLKLDEIRDFWGKAWEIINGAVENPSERKAVETLEAWQTRLEIERLELELNEPTLWLAANAVTQWIQHRPMGKNTKNMLTSADRRLADNLIGINSLHTSAVFREALTHI